MKLIYCNVVIGSVDEISQNGPELWGQIHLNENAEPLRELWAFITNEDNSNVEPPFSEIMLSDESWAMEDENGNLKPIYLPAVYVDGAISWHWRE